MLLLAHVSSGGNYAALKAHPYGTTKDVYTVYKLLKFLTVNTVQNESIKF